MIEDGGWVWLFQWAHLHSASMAREKKLESKVVELLKSQFVVTEHFFILLAFLVQLILSYFCVFGVILCRFHSFSLSIFLLSSSARKLVAAQKVPTEWKKANFVSVIICVHCFALNSLYFLPLNGFRRNVHIIARTYMSLVRFGSVFYRDV